MRRVGACDVHLSRPATPGSDRTAISQEAVMPRGDEFEREYKFSDRDDEPDDLGYGGGGSSFEEDDDEDGGWVLNQRDESLWDDADESEGDDEDETEAAGGDEDEEDEEAEVFPRPGRPGRPRKAPAAG